MGRKPNLPRGTLTGNRAGKRSPIDHLQQGSTPESRGSGDITGPKSNTRHISTPPVRKRPTGKRETQLAQDHTQHTTRVRDHSTPTKT